MDSASRIFVPVKISDLPTGPQGVWEIEFCLRHFEFEASRGP